MVIQGMELFAVAVVLLMFIMVLKQFGVTDPLLDGKNHHMVLMLAQFTVNLQ